VQSRARFTRMENSLFIATATLQLHVIVFYRSINYDAYEEYVAHLVRTGVSGVFCKKYATYIFLRGNDISVQENYTFLYKNCQV